MQSMNLHIPKTKKLTNTILFQLLSLYTKQIQPASEHLISTSSRINYQKGSLLYTNIKAIRVLKPTLIILMLIHVVRLEQGFLTRGTCTPWGYEAPKQGVRDEASE